MNRVRLIPVLLLDNGRVVKTVKFKNPSYIGDPINAVKIFNEKEVDELMILDIRATRESREPDYRLLEKICGEAFMPVGYGGGIRTFQQVRTLLNLGIEKVIFNTVAFENPSFIQECASMCGSQSIVVSIDVKKSLFGTYRACYLNATKTFNGNLKDFCTRAESLGAGEIFINNVDRDGTFQGLDLSLIADLSAEINIPLVPCGGLNSLSEVRVAVERGASGVAAGSFFVYRRPHNAVLISYPGSEQLHKEVY